MTKKRPDKRPRTMFEAILASASETVDPPILQPLQEAQRSQVIQPSRETQTSQTTQPSQATQASEHSSQMSQSTEKHVRGCARGMKKWGTGVKLQVLFDDNFQPLGHEGIMLKGQLGTIVRNPHRVPLTYVDWNSVPEDIKSNIWKEIEDNVEDCPEEFRPVAMHACKKIWKDYKCKIKTNFYVKNKDDPDILAKVPKNVLPNQWEELVTYWRIDKVKKLAETNSKNREMRGPTHKTGRTHFSQIRHEMSANGETVDKMSVFMKTRDEHDVDVRKLLEEYNRTLAEIPESLQTTEVRDEIFHKLCGDDGHGYCKTYGAGVSRNVVSRQSSQPKASSSSTLDEIKRQVQEATKEIEQRLTGEIERRLTEKFMDHLQRAGVRMTFESQEGTNTHGQVPDASSGHRIARESIGDETQGGDRISPLSTPSGRVASGHRITREFVRDETQGGNQISPLSTPFARLDGQDGQIVRLASYNIPKEDVADGIVISKNPLVKVYGKALGPEFWKVLIKNAINPKASLERPLKKMRTVGQAVGRMVAWRICDVFEEN